MKQIIFFLVMASLMGSGCYTIQKTELPQPSVENRIPKETPPPEPLPQEQIISQPATENTPTQQETSLYKGHWFDINYPSTFTASPQEPLNYHEGVEMILTDEAYFTSPDGDVEFYVYSPLWGGKPNYMEVKDNEKVVSEDMQTKENEFTTSRVTFKTVADINNAYTKSFAFYEPSIYEGQDYSEVSYVFGIKYKNQEAYNLYKEAYVDFKKSLQQYSD